MAYCQRCKRTWRELPDEQGDHPCPSCGGCGSDRSFDDLVELACHEVFQNLESCETIDDAEDMLSDVAGAALASYDGRLRDDLWEAVLDAVEHDSGSETNRAAARRLLGKA
jgi:hypothetical protein